MYVTDGSDKIFLSKEACIDPGLISYSFPSIGATQSGHNCSSTGGPNRHLSLPRCQRPPPPPTKLPFPAPDANRPDANRQKLQQYLLDYYKAGAFNTCEHQTLPLMDSPPMKLMLDPDAEPVGP